MLDASEKAVYFIQNRTRDDLDKDEMLALAIVRLLEVIGEAAKGVSESVRNLSPSIPWRQVAGTRDRLIHGYFDVDLDVVWSILITDLPQLIMELKQLLSKEI
jgi:uncharacterized protein with HEPN domain